MPTLPSLSSFSWDRKHTATSIVGYVHSCASSFLLPPPTHLSSLSSSRSYLPLPTPPSLMPIPQDRHHNSAASVVFPKSLGELSLIRPQTTPPVSLSSPWAHLLPTTPPLLLISWASQRDTDDSALVAAPLGASSLTLYRQRIRCCFQYLDAVFLCQRRCFGASQ